MEVRLVPMSKQDPDMKGKTILEIQKTFFENHLKNNSGFYKFKKEIKAKNGDLFLFQFDSQIIASAKLEKVENKSYANGYKGKYLFKTDTIKVFNPIDLNEFKKYTKDFKEFNQSPQKITITNLSKFIERTNLNDSQQMTNNSKNIIKIINKPIIKTKEDWIKVISNEEKQEKKEFIKILKFIYMSKNHISNLKIISEYLNINEENIYSIISTFGKSVIELLQLSIEKNITIQNIVWNIPFEINLNGNKNTMSCKLRPELINAIEEKFDWKGIYAIKNDEIHLERYNRYNREEIHNIFSPNTKFTPNSGVWGIKGIVPIHKEYTTDYIFFVTYGSKQSGYEFNETIDESGFLEWKCQPKQSSHNC